MNQSVTRAVVILEYLAEAGEPRDLAVISSDLAMNKSTVYRFLFSLAEHGYVRQDTSTGQYSLGAKVIWLASKFLESVEIRRIARPTLERLSSITGETIHLGLLDGFEILYVDKVDGRGAVRMASRIGSRLPVHCTALGKVLYSALPESEWEAYVSGDRLTARTSETITEPEVFYDELRKVQEQGYAIDNCENENGIRCVAAPIRDHAGRSRVALSISGWTQTMTLEKVQSLVPLVTQAAIEISHRAGFQDDDSFAVEGGKEASIES
jgi:IclR family acetate operon transcriptional repressor